MAPRARTVLLSSAGRRVALLHCLRRDAARLGLRLRVVACDLSPGWSAACHEADLAVAVPPCTHAEFVPRMLELCAREGVDLLIPTIDPELAPLSRSQDAFAARGTTVMVSSPAVVALARDKLRTADALAAAGLAVPRTAAVEEVVRVPQGWEWPLLLKPRDGSASQGLRTAQGPEDLAGAPAGYVAQTLLRGVEYTVNLFFDQRGALRCAVPHRRREVRAGEVAKGETCRHEGLEAAAWRLGQVLAGARGALCFQAIVGADGAARIFELNARFGGGYPLAHAAGAPFTRWLLEESAGLPPSCHNRWRAGVVMLRYDAAVFVEPAAAAP
jgi:carbamoyl-phosphate synthase large subunit